MKSKRELVLAAIFGGVIFVFGLWETIGAIVLQPLSDSTAAVDAVRSNLAALQDESTIIEQSLRNLKDLPEKCLPADPGTAFVMYQGWLIRQLEFCSIVSPVVSPSPPIAEESIGYRIPFVVQFDANSTNLARFLDQFHGTPLLHRITNLHVIRSANNADHHILLSIEVLSLDGSAAIESIPDVLPAEHQTTLESIIARNDFLGGSGVSRAVSTVIASPSKTTQAPADSSPLAEESHKAEPVKHPLECVRFVASVWNGRQREAWLVDSRSKKEVTVVAASQLTLPGIEAQIVAIGNDSLQLIVDGKPRHIKLGQTLNQSAALVTALTR